MRLHVGSGPRLVDEDQALRGNLVLPFLPPRPSTHDVGRSRSLATTLFLEAELLSVDEVPDPPIVHLETALGKLRHKTPQREGLFPSDAILKKTAYSSRIAFGLCPPIWPGARLPVPEPASPSQ